MANIYVRLPNLIRKGPEIQEELSSPGEVSSVWRCAPREKGQGIFVIGQRKLLYQVMRKGYFASPEFITRVRRESFDAAMKFVQRLSNARRDFSFVNKLIRYRQIGLSMTETAKLLPACRTPACGSQAVRQGRNPFHRVLLREAPRKLRLHHETVQPKETSPSSFRIVNPAKH